jgi:hypothetical protein
MGGKLKAPSNPVIATPLVVPVMLLIRYWPVVPVPVAVNVPVPEKPEPEKLKLKVSALAAEQQSSAARHIPPRLIQRKHFIERLRGAGIIFSALRYKDALFGRLGICGRLAMHA